MPSTPGPHELPVETFLFIESRAPSTSLATGAGAGPPPHWSRRSVEDPSKPLTALPPAHLERGSIRHYYLALDEIGNPRPCCRPSAMTLMAEAEGTGITRRCRSCSPSPGTRQVGVRTPGRRDLGCQHRQIILGGASSSRDLQDPPSLPASATSTPTAWGPLATTAPAQPALDPPCPDPCRQTASAPCRSAPASRCCAPHRPSSPTCAPGRPAPTPRSSAVTATNSKHCWPPGT